MNANNILFRCSSLGKIMTDPRSGGGITEAQLVKIDELSKKSKLTHKQSEELLRLIDKRDNPKIELSSTCISHLVELFVLHKYGRKKDVRSKYTNKGLMVEEESMTLYSLLKKEFYTKNTERKNNAFISGEPDINLNKIIKDLKSSWDIFTFFDTQHSDLNKTYYWQLQGYMDLFKADYSVLVYCLINTPDILIQDEKRRLMYQMGVIDDSNLDYQDACADLDRTMIYDDIPMEEKVLELPIERSDSDIKKMHERVELCREYMNEHLFKCATKNFVRVVK